METNKNIRRLGWAGLGAGLLTLLGCANYSGEGNEFAVSGVVTDAGDESLKVRITQISSANGQAENWFDMDAEHRLHDNCDCHGFFNGRKTYGTVMMSGVVVEPSDVPEGSCVDFAGKIRSDSEGKSHDDRPVFETAIVVPCRY